jgi:hypothetical protein
LDASGRRFSGLRDERARRSAAGAENRGRHGCRKRNGEKFVPTLAAESERDRSGDNRGQILPGAVPDRGLLHGCLADAALARRGFLHLGTHGVQVVASRDHREQQNEYAAENADQDERRSRGTSCLTIRAGQKSPLPPQQIRGQQEGQPAEIKKKLHTKYTTRPIRCNCLSIVRIAQRRQVTSVPGMGGQGRYGPCTTCSA